MSGILTATVGALAAAGNVPAFAAAYYFKADVDNLWESLANWWSVDDGTGEHPATIPWATEDTATVDLALVTGETTMPEIHSDLGVTDAAWEVTGTLTMDGFLPTYNNIYSGNFAISGQGLELVGASCKFGGVLNGAARFYGDGSYNGGDITGDCVFDGTYCYNNATITGVATFAGEASSNASTVTGACYFSGMNAHNGGTINGNVEFGGSNSCNDPSGTITGDTLFSGATSFNNGTINGITTFGGSGSYNDNLGQLNGNATFTGIESFNEGGILGNVEVNASSVRISGVITGNLAFSSASDYSEVTDLSLYGTMLTVDGPYIEFLGTFNIEVDDVAINGQECCIYGSLTYPANLNVTNDIVVSGYNSSLNTVAYSTSLVVSATRMILLPGAEYFWGASYNTYDSLPGMLFDIYCEAPNVSLGNEVTGGLYITAAAYGSFFNDGNITEIDTNWTVPTPWPD